MKYASNTNRNLSYSLFTCIALFDYTHGFSLLIRPSLQSRIIYKKNTHSSIYLYPSNPKRKNDVDPNKLNPQITNGEPIQPSTNLSQSSVDLDPTLGIGLDSMDAMNGQKWMKYDYNNNAQKMETIHNQLDDENENPLDVNEDISMQDDGLSKIIYSACLITANTVGAGILLLPDAISSSGVVIPLAIFIGEFVFFICYKRWRI